MNQPNSAAIGGAINEPNLNIGHDCVAMISSYSYGDIHPSCGDLLICSETRFLNPMVPAINIVSAPAANAMTIIKSVKRR